MPWKKSSEKLIEQFYASVESLPEKELRKMFGYPCCFVKGNMFTGLHEENWVLRLSEQDRSEMIDKHGAHPFEPMKGRMMREYVALPNSIKENGNLLHSWLEKSYEFVSSLPPKKKKPKSPTTRQRKKQ